MSKKKVTLSIESKVYDDFQKYCDERAIMLSKRIELFMESFVHPSRKHKLSFFTLGIIMILFLVQGASAASIFTEGFESGLAGWNATFVPGANNWTASVTNPFQGILHAQSQPQSTIEPASVLERGISTVGYQTINFSYSRRLIGLDAADEFKAKWYNGTTWIIVEETLGNSVDDVGYIAKGFILNVSGENNANVRVRFECTAGAVSEFCRVDNVNLTGDAIIDSTPPLISIVSPTNGTFSTLMQRLNVSVIETSVDSVWISIDGRNFTYGHRNGTIDFGFLDPIFIDDFGTYLEGSNASPVWTNPLTFGSAVVDNKTYKLYNETALDDALAYITLFNQSNYWASTRAMVPAGYFGGAYLTPRFGDVNNKYEIALDYDFSSININKVVSGTWSSLGALWTGDLPSPIFVSKGEWHTVGLSVRGNNISAFVDGQFALNVSDGSLSSTGFSLIAFDDTDTHLAYFDDVEIHRELSHGAHQLIVYANDTFGNSNSTSISFFVDSGVPSTMFVSPTESNGSVIARSNIMVNVSASDANLANITISLFNTTGLVNASVFFTSSVFVNFTGLSDGVYYFNATSIDEFGALNNTETRVVTIDATPPSLSIISPQNGTYINGSILVNITSNGTYVWFFNGTANESYTSSVFRTFAVGSHSLIAYANDSLGNLNTSFVGFTVIVNSLPNVSLNAPANGSIFNIPSVILNASVFDDEQNMSVWFYGDGVLLTNFSSQPNATTLSYNWSGLSNGLRNWTVIASDGFDNSTLEYRYFSVNGTGSAPLVSLSSPGLCSTFGYNQTIALNLSVISSALGSCWYTLDNGATNFSLQSCLNATFNVSGNGNYELVVYANETIEGLIGTTRGSFGVTAGPTIIVDVPRNNTAVNYSFVNFTYFTEGNATNPANSCSLYGNFNGTFALNQSAGIVNGARNSFFVNLTQGKYLWNVVCNNTVGVSQLVCNYTLTSDVVPPNVSLAEPNGTYASSNVPIIINVTDDLSGVNTNSCLYNLTFSVNGTTFQVGIISGCENTQLIIGTDGSYTLNVSAGDNAGNRESSSNNFVVSSNPGGTTGGTSGGASGGSSGGGDVPGLSGFSNVSFDFIDSASLIQGEETVRVLRIRNTGLRFLNKCSLSFGGTLGRFVSNDQTASLSSGEAFDYLLNFALYDVSSGPQFLEVIVQCDELRRTGLIPVVITQSDFGFVFNDYERNVDSLIVSYSLQENLGLAQDIHVDYSLINAFNASVARGEDDVSLPSNSQITRSFTLRLPKDTFGEFILAFDIDNGDEKRHIEEPVFLSSRGLTGLAISEGNRRALSIFAIVILGVLLAFGVWRFLRRQHRLHEHYHAPQRKIIRLRIKP